MFDQMVSLIYSFSCEDYSSSLGATITIAIWWVKIRSLKTRSTKVVASRAFFLNRAKRPELTRDQMIPLNLLFPGDAWYTIIIRRAEELRENYCDSDSDCDFFVRIFIDDNRVYETPRKSNMRAPRFDYTYISDVIPSSSRVRLELWDYDDFFNGADDLMLEAEYRAGSINGQKLFSNNNCSLEIFNYINDPKTWPYHRR